MRKKQIVTVAALLGIAVMAGSSWAADTASVEMGKKLFADPALGGAGNQKSCATCHVDGKGLDQAAKKANLVERINSCIAGALGGKELDPKGAKLESLLLYIKSLEKK